MVSKAKKIGLLQNPDSDNIMFIHAIMTGGHGETGEIQTFEQDKAAGRDFYRKCEGDTAVGAAG